MSFEDNVRLLQRAFRNAGYEIVRNPVDISVLAKADRVVDCEIIARKDFFNIMYMEVESNWKALSSDMVSKSRYPCLLITRYRNTQHILTTVQWHGTHNAKPRHFVPEIKFGTCSLYAFIRSIKAAPYDDHIAIDKKVQGAFDQSTQLWRIGVKAAVLVP